MNFKGTTLALSLLAGMLHPHAGIGATVVYDESTAGDLGDMRQSDGPLLLGFGQNEILGRASAAFGTLGSNRGVVLETNDSGDYFEFRLPDDSRIDSLAVTFELQNVGGSFSQLDFVLQSMIWDTQQTSFHYLWVECSALVSPSPSGCAPSSGMVKFADGAVARLGDLGAENPAYRLAAMAGIWALPDTTDTNVDSWNAEVVYKWSIGVTPVPEPGGGTLLLLGLGAVWTVRKTVRPGVRSSRRKA